MSDCRNGTRAVLGRVGDGIRFNLRFGAGEFLDKSNERQLGPGVVVVARRFAEQFAVGNDHKLRLEGRRHQSIDAEQFSGLDDRHQPYGPRRDEHGEYAAPELRRHGGAADSVKRSHLAG